MRLDTLARKASVCRCWQVSTICNTVEHLSLADGTTYTYDSREKMNDVR
jgi:hypothetical protein